MGFVKFKKALLIARNVGAVGFLALWGANAFAGGASSLSDVVSTLEGNVTPVAELLSYVAYVTGVGFCIAGILQFKAHKDNPAQVPLSKPIVHLGVGAGLLFLPSLMQIAGQSIFGEGATGAKSGHELSGF